VKIGIEKSKEQRDAQYDASMLSIALDKTNKETFAKFNIPSVTTNHTHPSL
jgi:hypothetical protein